MSKAKVVGQPAGASLHGKVVNENSRANLRAFQMLDFVAILVYIRAPAHYRIMQAFEPHRFLVLLTGYVRWNARSHIT